MDSQAPGRPPPRPDRDPDPDVPAPSAAPPDRAALMDALRRALTRDTVLYVNYPFCRTLCSYCIFKLLPFEPGRSRQYLGYLRRDAAGYVDALQGFRFDCLHLGGGTPNLVPPAELFEAVSGLVDFGRPPRQVVVEVRPQEDLAEWLAAARPYGITKVILGVQSLDERVLAQENRPVAPALAERCMALLRDSGLQWSVDLIVGFRGEKALGRRAPDELARVLEYRPTGVHLYRMRSERRNRFYDRASAPDDDKLEFWNRSPRPGLGAALAAAGYQYVGDEWCRPEGLDHSRTSLCHDDALGAQPEVVGIGLGARTDTRAGWWATHRKLREYMAALDRGELPLRVRVDYGATNLYAVSQVRKEMRLQGRIGLEKFAAAARITGAERAELDAALDYSRRKGARFLLFEGNLEVDLPDYTLFLRSLDEYMEARCRGERPG